MKKRISRHSGCRVGMVVMAGGLLSGCSLPSRVTWQRVKEEGLVKVFFSPKKVEAMPSEAGPAGPARQELATTTWGSAQLEGSTAPQDGLAAMPTAQPFPGRAGFVYSPHTNPKKLVSVKGFAAGEQVLCPYTLEPFVVPSFGQGPVALMSPPPLPTFGPEKSGEPETIDLVSRDSTPPILAASSQVIYGTWVEGRPGYVNSPFAAKHQLVDVTGIAPGVEVRCPYSGRIFRVPESPVESPATSAAPPDLPAPPTETPESTPETPKPTTPQPPPTPAPEKPAVAPAGDVPVARWVEGKPGLVQTPHGDPGQLVDVSDRPAGAKVICPFTGKPFLVPAR